MASYERLAAIKGSLLLNNGTSASGAIRTITQNMGTLNPEAWDVDKVVNIASAVAPLFDKSLYQIQGVKTYNVFAE